MPKITRAGGADEPEPVDVDPPGGDDDDAEVVEVAPTDDGTDVDMVVSGRLLADGDNTPDAA